MRPDEAKTLALIKKLVAEGMPLEEARRVALAQHGADYRQQLKDEFDAGQAARRAVPPEPVAQPEPPVDMSRFDVLPGDNSRTQRVWNPQTRTYDQVLKPKPFDPQAAEREADAARIAANISQHYGPEEAAQWQAANDRGNLYVPATPTMRKKADDLTANQYAAMSGDEEATQYLRGIDERRLASRRPGWIREAGLDPDAPETQNMSPAALAKQATDARAAKKQARELQWRAQMMMNAGNFAGALALPGIDDNMRTAVLNQQTAALNSRRPGAPIQFGPNPLGVQAAQAAGDAKNGDTDVRLAAIQADMDKARAELEQRRQEAIAAQQRWQEEAEARREEQRQANERHLEQVRAENARSAAQLEASRQASEREWSTRDKMNSDNASAEREKAAAAQRLQEERDRQTAENLAKKERDLTVIAPMEAKHGPGVRHILAGSYETPEAQASLESMAAAADQSWTGFYNSDAVRLDATLQRLGVADPSVRRGLVNFYGLGPGAAFGPGGRSGPISNTVNWWYGDPRYQQSPPPGP
jgi:hypothetical protein